MKIYTSYFAKIKELEKNNIFCIGICAIPPDFFNGPNIPIVAPTKSILFDFKKDHDKNRYIQRYNDEVLSLFKNKEQWQILIDRLSYISGGKDIALCCYEKPKDFCHRHLLAERLNKELNLDITEYKFLNDDIYESYVLF